MTDVHTIRKQLDALRVKHGADTPIGHRCSNIIELLKAHGIATGFRKAYLAFYIERQMAGLAALDAEH